jgi:cell wall-associated NlpC family hydrolase
MKKHSEINWSRFRDLGLKLVGKPYVFGAETNLKDADPDHITGIDCSETSEWMFAQVFIVAPDGAYNQFKVCRPIQGDPLIGDLGFKWDPETRVVHHVGIYLGNNEVLEAKGKSWGVVLTPRDVYEKSSHFAMWGRLNQIIDA